MNITEQYLQKKYGIKPIIKASQELDKDKSIPLLITEMERLCKKYIK